MKALNYSIILILLTASLSCFAKEDFEKKYHEEFKVNKQSLFEIKNTFGNIDIENIDEDKIIIDVEIIIQTSSQKKADPIFEKIDIDIAKESNTIKAITKIDKMRNGNVNFKINYVVKMPAYLNINLSNKFGNVNINELHGKSNIKLKFGTLTANKILDDNSKPLSSIQLNHCEKSHISELNWGKVVVKFSKIEIEKGTAIVLSSEFSKIQLGQFSSVIVNGGYDDYNIKSIKNLVIDVDYSDISVDNISNKLDSDNEYGKIKINNISKDFKEVNITSKYNKVDVSFAPNCDYLITAKSEHTGMNYPDLQIIERIKENSKIYLKAYKGNKESESKVTIYSEYGDIEIN